MLIGYLNAMTQFMPYEDGIDMRRPRDARTSIHAYINSLGREKSHEARTRHNRHRES